MGNMSVSESGVFDVGLTVERLTDEFLAHIRSHRDLTDGSLSRHRRYASAFLVDSGVTGEVALSETLSVASVQAYASAYAKGHGHAATRDMFGTMRLLLRYLYIEGHLPNELSAAVPCIPRRRLSHVPRGIGERDIERLLRSVDRTQDIGKRDYCMILLLSTYGVRGVQVRQLTLDDIHWSENQIVFQPTKGGKRIIQHLSAAVGNSLLDYLRESRPRHVPSREVFLTCTVPPRPFGHSNTLSAVVHSRLKAAGIELPAGVSRGAHGFRHAFASRMVCGSVAFKQVADMLGHRDLNSTMIYTKIDLPSLRQATIEWPQVSS
jgi:integrase/recombinase XerD